MLDPSDIAQRFTVACSDIAVPPEEQTAYIRFHEEIDLEDHSETEVMHTSSRLFATDVAMEEKRGILFRLAHIGNIASFDLICMYLKQPDPSLHTWAILCLEECRMLLEMDILDAEGGGIIMGPSGGVGDRLRHHAVIGIADGAPWHDAVQKTARSAFLRACDTWNSQIEECVFGRDYLKLSLLIHIDTAADDLLMKGICLANEQGPLFREHYYISNVEDPDEERIRQYLTGALE